MRRLAAIALLVLAFTGMGVKRRAAAQRWPGYTDLQVSCWIWRSHIEEIAAVRAYVAKHQPAPPRLVDDIDVISENEALLEQLAVDACDPPAQFQGFPLLPDGAKRLREALIEVTEFGDSLP